MTASVSIGLVGRNGDTGLGYQNASIAKYLNVARWLIGNRGLRCEHRSLPSRAKCVAVAQHHSPRQLSRMVTDLDCLLFAERPEPSQLVEIASREGVAIACIPNWEHLRPTWIGFPSSI